MHVNNLILPPDGGAGESEEQRTPVPKPQSRIPGTGTLGTGAKPATARRPGECPDCKREMIRVSDRWLCLHCGYDDGAKARGDEE